MPIDGGAEQADDQRLIEVDGEDAAQVDAVGAQPVVRQPAPQRPAAVEGRARRASPATQDPDEARQAGQHVDRRGRQPGSARRAS